MVIEDIGLYYGVKEEDYMGIDAIDLGYNHNNTTKEEYEREKAWGQPIYECFMLNYKDIQKDVFHRLNVFTLNENDMELLDNIDVEWIDPVISTTYLEDIDLQSNNGVMRGSGIAKMAFLTYKK